MPASQAPGQDLGPFALEVVVAAVVLFVEVGEQGAGGPCDYAVDHTFVADVDLQLAGLPPVGASPSLGVGIDMLVGQAMLQRHSHRAHELERPSDHS